MKRIAAALLMSLLMVGIAYGATVTGQVTIQAAFSQTVSTGVTETFSIPASLRQTITYTNGTGAGQIDTLYAKSLTLSATPTTLDLTSLVDPSGATVNFARVREVFIYNPDAVTTHTVLVSAGASNGWTVLPPVANALACVPSGGILHISDRNGTRAGNGNVTGASSKTIKLDPGAFNITIFVILSGGSAA